MQFDFDLNSKFSNLFLKVREVILSYDGITEVKNPKQTSYRDKNGVILMLRSREDKLVLSFGKGVLLQKSYPFLEGSGKIVRYWNLKSLNDLDEKLLREMIEESIILNIEYQELKKLKQRKR